MAPSISKRAWIAWDAQPQGEPTSTLVLTSADNRFVDIRILKESPSDPPETARQAAIQPLDQLDWAFAGFSTSEAVPDGTGPGPRATHSQWTHFVDSHHLDADQVVDKGTMYPQPDGRVLERGSMVNPATGHMSPYEEMWEDVRLRTNKQGKVECAVLQLHDDSHGLRGMVVRLGQYCQGIVRSGHGVALERWEWAAPEDGWQRSVRMGDLFLPCGAAMDFDKLQLGGKVKFGEVEWDVVEMSLV